MTATTRVEDEEAAADSDHSTSAGALLSRHRKYKCTPGRYRAPVRFAIGFLPSRELGRVLDDYYNHLLALEIGPEHAEAAKRALALDDEIAELLTNT